MSPYRKLVALTVAATVTVGLAAAVPAVARPRGDGSWRSLVDPAPTHYVGKAALHPVAVHAPATSTGSAQPAGSTTRSTTTRSTTAGAATATSVSDGQGGYGATPLTPAGSGGVGAHNGDFSWAYPMRVPPPAAGPSPSLALSYDSQSVDGRTVATNAQPSWVGEGWDLSLGSIQRSYVPCASVPGQPAAQKTGDQCWAGENATLSLPGHSSALVLDGATKTWHLKDDDGSSVSHVTANGNDYWLVTTQDGTKYYFGQYSQTHSVARVPVYDYLDSGSACRPATTKATFDASCLMPWSWSLDHVVDRNGNAEVVYYASDTNHYDRQVGSTQNVETYQSSIYPTRVDYGLVSGHEFDTNAATDRVVFRTGDRCLASCTTHNSTTWPDTPWDQYCSSTTSCTQQAPSFWSTVRLAGIDTQYWNGSAYQTAESWNLTHDLAASGDGTPGSLRVTQVTHVAGGLSLVTKFGYTSLPNRVNTTGDGLPPLDKWRLTDVTSETGADTTVTYAGADCTPGSWPAPQSNTTRCFPVQWTPAGYTAPITDWFTKYVVTALTTKESDGDGLFTGQTTTYSYSGGAAWHHDEDTVTPETMQTWSNWRGYQKVTITSGDSTDGPRTQQVVRYYRGMSNDPLPNGANRGEVDVTDAAGKAHNDAEELAGRTLDTSNLDNAGGAEVSGALDSYWVHPTATETISNPTSSDSTQTITETANFVRSSQVLGRTAVSTGTRTTETDTTYDATTGLPVKADDHGDTSITTDDRCTTTSYVAASGNPVNLPAEVATYGTNCGAVGSTTTPVSDVQTYYDNSATLGAAAVHGDPTRVRTLKSGSGSTAVWETATASFDSLGRKLTSVDPLGNTTTTAYTALTSTAPASVRVTDALGHATTKYLEPLHGLTTAVVDPNSHRTDYAYDSLGRLTDRWDPDRPKNSTNTTGNVHYSYALNSGTESSVRIQTLRRDGTYSNTYQLYDSLLRLRQTQTDAPSGDATVIDDLYDSQGRLAQVRGPYPIAQAPSATLYPGDQSQIPDIHRYTYDGVGRQTADILQPDGTPESQTTTAYSGDVTTVTPPAGGTLTSVVTDARGQVTQRRQYTGSTTASSALTTTYTYDAAGRTLSMTDPTGATWKFGYDIAGNQISTSDPDTGSSTATFDDDNHVLTTTDSRKITLTYKYDQLGRKTELDQGTTVLATWTYDAAGQLGLPSAATSYVGGKAYTERVDTYDVDDRPLQSDVVIPDGALPGVTGAKTYTTTLAYNAAGDLFSTQVPAVGDLPSDTVSRGYTTLGQPNSLYTASKYLVLGTDYTPNNQVQDFGLDNGNGSLTRAGITYTYDPETGRTVQILDKTPSTTAADLHYTYDPSGQVTELQDTSASDVTPGAVNDTQCFGYDGIQRLTAAWTPASGTCGSASSVTASQLGGPAPYWNTYVYDGVGDRSSQVVHATSTAGKDTNRSYNYSGSGHAHAFSAYTDTTSAGSTTANFQYDALGDMTSRPGHTYTYDAQGRTATDTTTSGSTSKFVYDASGTLLLTTNPDGSVLLNLPGSDDVATDLSISATGTQKAVRYYSWNGNLVATRTSAGLALQFTDLHGTQVASASPGSAYTITHTYTDPFGNGRGPSAGAAAGNRGFVGGLNEASGIVRLGQRDYDPGTGRFISVDPEQDLTDPQSLGGYAYSDDDPVIKADPNGTRVACLDDGTHCDGSGVTHTVLPKGGGWSDDNDVCNSPGGERQCGGTSTHYADPPAPKAKKRMHSVWVHRVLHSVSSVSKAVSEASSLVGAFCTLGTLTPAAEVAAGCVASAEANARLFAGVALVADTADAINGGTSWGEVGGDAVNVALAYQGEAMKTVATKLFGPGKAVRQGVYDRIIDESRSVSNGRMAGSAEGRARAVADAVARHADREWSERVFKPVDVAGAMDEISRAGGEYGGIG